MARLVPTLRGAWLLICCEEQKLFHCYPLACQSVFGWLPTVCGFCCLHGQPGWTSGWVKGGARMDSHRCRGNMGTWDKKGSIGKHRRPQQIGNHILLVLSSFSRCFQLLKVLSVASFLNVTSSFHMI